METTDRTNDDESHKETHAHRLATGDVADTYGPYVFCDLDGVLNREYRSLPHTLHENINGVFQSTTRPGFDPRCVRPLNTLLMLFPSATLVITSTLRRHLTYRQLAATLDHHGVRCHRLATTSRMRDEQVHDRADEIRAFLDTANSNTCSVPFVVLDTMVTCAVFRKKFVLVNPVLGLTDTNASCAASVLIDQGVELKHTTLHSFITNQEYPDHGIGIARKPTSSHRVIIGFDSTRRHNVERCAGSSATHGFLNGTSGDVI